MSRFSNGSKWPRGKYNGRVLQQTYRNFLTCPIANCQWHHFLQHLWRWASQCVPQIILFATSMVPQTGILNVAQKIMPEEFPGISSDPPLFFLVLSLWCFELHWILSTRSQKRHHHNLKNTTTTKTPRPQSHHHSNTTTTTITPQQHHVYTYSYITFGLLLSGQSVVYCFELHWILSTRSKILEASSRFEIHARAQHMRVFWMKWNQWYH